jgi:hypothetical protein
LRGLASRAAYAPSASTSPGGEHAYSTNDTSDHHAAATATSAGYITDGGTGDETPRPVLLDTSPSGIATRSMQRRLQQQQRTIRLLMLVMGLVIVGSIIVISAIIMRMANQQDAQPGSTSQPPAAPSSANAGGNNPATSPPASAGSADETTATTEPLEQDVPSATAPVVDENDLSAPAIESAAASSIEADHERAMALLGEARKESRALKERIKDCEEAVALLKAIKARVSAEEAPASLDQQITEAESLLERLRLQEYFP